MKFKLLLGALLGATFAWGSAVATVVRMDFDYGDSPGQSVYLQLFDTGAPKTVANFLNYVQNANGDRRYDGTFVHRSAKGFVLQGGGYSYDPSVGPFSATSAPHIAQDPPVVNEYDVSRSNVRGTIAMAKLGGDPDSATSEWFFNLADNSANLDFQNGGFTVFGRVLGKGMDVVDTIAGMPLSNQGGVFSALPLVDAARPIYPSNLVTLRRVVVVPAGIAVDPLDADLRFAEVGGTPASMVVTVHNFGASDLVIGSIGDTDPVGAPFSIAPSGDNCSGVTLAPEGECTLTVEFSPVAAGVAQDSFNIPSNDGSTPELTVSLKGTGAAATPLARLEPSSGLDLGAAGVGIPRYVVATLRNAGGGQLAPAQISFTGPDAALFSVDSDTCVGASLAINESCGIFVRLAGWTVASVSATLQVDADPGSQVVTLPLSGTVVQAQSVIGLPASVDVGDAQAGQTVAAAFTINNTGVDDLYLSAIDFVGAQASLFSTGAACLQKAIAPGSNCTQLIKFTSTQGGNFSATMRVSSNDPNNPVMDVSVSATASEDGDGVPDAVELAGPHGGDANQDGVPDNMQDNVATFLNLNGQYVTLETDTGLALKNVRAIDNPSPSNMPLPQSGTLDFPQGFFSFSVANVPVGGAATVTLDLPDGQVANGYFKYAGFWYDFAYNPQTGTGAQYSGNRVVLHFVDGKAGDNDRLANGVITDPGGPAVFSSPGASSGGGGCNMLSSQVAGTKPAGIDFVLMLLGFGVLRASRARRCRSPVGSTQ